MYNIEEETSLRWLSTILDILRQECPWDKKQTPESLRYLSIEEVYELSETILADNSNEEKKELGDLFMHLLFYSKIAEDRGDFSTSDVIDGICRKLISRHPHIALPDRNGLLQESQCQNQPKWEEVKMKEGRKSVLEGVPPTLPALVKAVRMQEKVAGIGFTFPSPEKALEKAKEEYRELQEALASNTQESQKQKQVEEEFGDLLFALIQWGRMIGVNADDALSRTNLKFQHRFTLLEQNAQLSDKKISDLSFQELLQLWQQAKQEQLNIMDNKANPTRNNPLKPKEQQ